MPTNQTPEELAEDILVLSVDLLSAAAYFRETGCAKEFEAAVAAHRSAVNRLRDMAASGAKDAERYRWLRDEATGEIVFDHTEDKSDGDHHFALYVPFDGREIPDDEASGQTLDEAIDAAIDATKRGGA